MIAARRHRKSIRLKEYDYSRPGAYFITICTRDKQCILSNIIDGKLCLREAGKIVEECWHDIPKHFSNVELDEFVIMPDHIHGIVMIHEPVGAIHESPLPATVYERRTMMLPKIIGRLKMNSAKQINVLQATSGSHVWQRNYYEHIIRNSKELNNIRRYILGNPVLWGLENNDSQLFPTV
jgi:REP element-mobilizing transposase RayT